MGEIFPYSMPPYLEMCYIDNYQPSEIFKINQAYCGAWLAHFGQYRKQKKNGKLIPYITHPVAMTHITMDEFHVYDSDVIITELLHDTTEPSRIAYFKEGIAIVFSETIAEYNTLITKNDENRKLYLANMIASGKWVVMFSKLIDRLHNMRTLDGLSEAFQQKQAKETREFFLDLCDNLAHVIPAKYKHIPPLLRDKLEILCVQYGC